MQDCKPSDVASTPSRRGADPPAKEILEGVVVVFGIIVLWAIIGLCFVVALYGSRLVSSHIDVSSRSLSQRIVIASRNLASRIDAYQKGAQWRLLLVAPAGESVDLAHYRLREDCEARREGELKMAFVAHTPVPAIECASTETWWIQAWVELTKIISPTHRSAPKRAEQFPRSQGDTVSNPDNAVSEEEGEESIKQLRQFLDEKNRP